MSSFREMITCTVNRSMAPSFVIMNRRRREYVAWLMMGPMKYAVLSPAPGLGFRSATCLCAVFIPSQIMGSNTKRMTSLRPMGYLGLEETFMNATAKAYVNAPNPLYTTRKENGPIVVGSRIRASLATVSQAAMNAPTETHQEAMCLNPVSS